MFNWRSNWVTTNIFGTIVNEWYLNNLGITTPSSTPTYTGATTGRWLPDSTGTLIQMAGLVNPLGQAIPPVSGGTIKTTEATGAILGSEVISVAADREFSSDTGYWTKGSGVAIGSGTCNFTSVADGVGLTRATALTVGRRYKVVFTTSGMTGGGIKGGLAGTSRTTNGTWSEEIVATSTTMGFYAVGTTTGSIDNVSWKEVLPTLTANTSGSMVFHAAFTNKVTARKRNVAADFTTLQVGGTTTDDNVTISGDAAATCSVVSDTAALAAAGLGTICDSGRVYKLDNSAGSIGAVIAFSGATGNTNKHSSSLYIRLSGANGELRLNASGGTIISPSAAYTLIKEENVTPSDTSRLLRVSVNAGGTAFFILPCLTETSSAPLTPGVDYADGLNAVTVPATDLSFATASIPPLNLPSGYQFREKATPRALPGTDQVLFGCASSGCQLYIRGTDNKVVWRGASLGADLVDTMNASAAWTAYGTNTVADDADEVKITFVDNALGAFASFSAAKGLSANLEVGKVYELVGNARVNAGSSVTVAVETSSASTIATITSTTKTPFTTRFVATSATGNFLRAGAMGAGEIIWFDDITVKEVKEIATAALTGVGTTQRIGFIQTPQGASISLDGTVTTDATMTTMPTFGANVDFGSNNNLLYFTGELALDSSNRFLSFRDTNDSTWYASNTF